MSLWYVVGAMIGLAICTHFGANYTTIEYLIMATIIGIMEIVMQIIMHYRKG